MSRKEFSCGCLLDMSGVIRARSGPLYRQMRARYIIRTTKGSQEMKWSFHLTSKFVLLASCKLILSKVVDAWRVVMFVAIVVCWRLPATTRLTLLYVSQVRK